MNIKEPKVVSIEKWTALEIITMIEGQSFRSMFGPYCAYGAQEETTLSFNNGERITRTRRHGKTTYTVTEGLLSVYRQKVDTVA